jgi:glycosyltransferase involved in cell wall biosynthesis
LIEETLASALGQTYQDIEVIVTDNNSTDRTFAILEKAAQCDNRLRIFRNASNVGPVRNWARAIGHARGEYIKILWSDDLIEPDFVEKCLNVIAGRNDIGFVFSAVVLFGDGFRRPAHFVRGAPTGVYDSTSYIAATLLGENLLFSPGCALFRTESLRKNLLLDVPNKIGSDFSLHAIGNDLLMYLLTAADYPSIGYIDEPLSLFRAHKNSITVSSDSARLRTMYFLAMAHFVENHITDKKLVGKFNAVLQLNLNRIRKSGIGITRIDDFYYGSFDCSIDWIYFIKIKLLKKFKKINKNS